MSHHSISHASEIPRQWKIGKGIKLPKPKSGSLNKAQKRQLLEFVRHLSGNPSK